MRSNAVPWLLKEVQDIVELQKTQHKDLNKIYEDVNNKGKSAHKQSIDNEKKRIRDIKQDREDKRLYKIALKEAKQKWKAGIKVFR